MAACDCRPLRELVFEFRYLNFHACKCYLNFITVIPQEVMVCWMRYVEYDPEELERDEVKCIHFVRQYLI